MAAAFLSISTPVCQMSQSLTRRSGAFQYVFSQQNRWDLKGNSIIQHTTKQKWILTVPRGAIPGCQREPAFGGFDPTTSAGWSSMPEPDSATAASARGGTVLKTSAIFMFPFLRFAVLFLL